VNTLVLILDHTPKWVFGVFALLLWIGAQGLRTRTFPLLRVWVTPAVFLTLSVTGAIARHQPPVETALAWLAGAALALGPGAWTSPRHLEVDRVHKRVRFRGSPFPLVRNVVIFAAQYVLAVAAARGAGASVAIWAIGVSGASAGYFLGWSGMFLRRILQAPTVGLTAEPRDQSPRVSTTA
jgi:hypothetical protein